MATNPLNNLSKGKNPLDSLAVGSSALPTKNTQTDITKIPGYVDPKTVSSKAQPATQPIVPPKVTQPKYVPAPIPAPIIQPQTQQYTQVTPPTYTNTQIAIESSAEKPAQPTTTPQPTQPTQKDQVQTYLDKLLGRDVAGEKAKLREDAGLLAKQEEANRLQNELASRKRAYEKEIKALEKNPEGMSTGGLDGRISDLRRKANEELADIAIQAEFANNNYLGAEKILNSQIADLNDEYDMQVQNYQLAVDFLRDDLTESEKLEIQNNLAIEKEKRDNEEYRLRESFNRAAEQSDPLYRARLANEQLQGSKLAQDIASIDNTDVFSSQVNNLVSSGDPVDNKTAIAAILSGKAVSAGTKGRLAPANSVLGAVEEFANMRQTGKFTGVGVFGATKEFLKGIVNAESPSSITNKQNIDAINLKVQQWASGASLTEQQTKQVDKLTPKVSDSDKVVRTKLNGLYNYMLNQVESDLLTDGVNVNFKPVNLFENMELLEKASPEQLKLLKDNKLIE